VPSWIGKSVNSELTRLCRIEIAPYRANFTSNYLAEYFFLIEITKINRVLIEEITGITWNQSKFEVWLIDYLYILPDLKVCFLVGGEKEGSKQSIFFVGEREREEMSDG
jgi:hypothetical protein